MIKTLNLKNKNQKNDVEPERTIRHGGQWAECEVIGVFYITANIRERGHATVYWVTSSQCGVFTYWFV